MARFAQLEFLQHFHFVYHLSGPSLEACPIGQSYHCLVRNFYGSLILELHFAANILIGEIMGTGNNTETARIVRFHETGGSSVLQIDELSRTSPEPDEVRIEIAAIGLNRAEVMFRNGAYLVAPSLPSRIGYEASGVIDAVGSNVTEFAIGDRVSTIPALSMSEYGVYGESATVPAYAVAKYPENLTPIEGTAIWMQYITAWGGLIDIGKLQAGQNIIITAASSSVGLSAIQIAKSVGATVIATTRGPSKVDSLLKAGADHVVQTGSEDLAERTAEITGGVGAHLIFDPVGGPMLQALADAAALGGMIIEYGALDDRETPYPLFTALGKGLSIRGYTLFEITSDAISGARRDRLEAAKDYVFNGVSSGDLKPIIDKTFPLDSIRDAHEHLESNEQIGKIVVTV